MSCASLWKTGAGHPTLMSAHVYRGVSQTVFYRLLELYRDPEHAVGYRSAVASLTIAAPVP